jgi:hypothetical protein
MPKAKTQPEKPLAERIAEFRAELDAFIDSRAEALKQESPGVPFRVLRNILTVRASGCQCQAAQNILEGS